MKHFLDRVRAHGTGVFVVTKSSFIPNPGSNSFASKRTHRSGRQSRSGFRISAAALRERVATGISALSAEQPCPKRRFECERSFPTPSSWFPLRRWRAFRSRCYRFQKRRVRRREVNSSRKILYAYRDAGHRRRGVHQRRSVRQEPRATTQRSA